MAEISDSDTFKILVATDIHLGYQHERNKGVSLKSIFLLIKRYISVKKIVLFSSLICVT